MKDKRTEGKMEGVMKKKYVLITAMAILLAAGTIAAVFFSINRRSYELHLPTPEKLAGVSVEKENRQAEITDGKEVKDLIDVLSGSGRSTKKESISDAPRGAEELLKVDFHFAQKGISTLFLYEKGGCYYIEQPYNGIYMISDEEYRAVGKYVG